MPIAFWCVLAAVVLAYIPTAIPKGKKAVSGYDNARPRETQARFTGFSARAYGAHQNGLEAFGLFAVAVLTATVLKSPHTSQNCRRSAPGSGSWASSPP
jgi:uncharacterized MAPEG superfamily protein